MNPTSRAIFQSVLASDATLSPIERSGLERILSGDVFVETTGGAADQLLLSQKKAAQVLDVSRFTIWRMVKDCVLHPVELTPGTWRYPYGELRALSRGAAVAPGRAVA